MSSIKKAIFAKSNVVKLDIPELDLYVKKITVEGRDIIDSFIAKKQKEQSDFITGLRSIVICACLCDSAGQLIFQPSEIKDIETQLDAEMADIIFGEALKINKLFQLKNSETAESFLEQKPTA